MTKEEVLQKVNDIFIDILDNEDIVLTYDTTANDVEDWDSLTHIQLVVAIEKQFKVRFTSLEIQSWKNVGEMIDCILGKGI
jgi:acyl carrier protein